MFINVQFDFVSNCTKCLKNQPRDVIKRGKMRGEVGKKNLKTKRYG